MVSSINIRQFHGGLFYLTCNIVDAICKYVKLSKEF